MFVKIDVLVILEVVPKHGLPTHRVRDIPEESFSELGRCINICEVSLWSVNYSSLQIISPEAVTGIGLHPGETSLA
jgi:hypothetical protein